MTEIINLEKTKEDKYQAKIEEAIKQDHENLEYNKSKDGQDALLLKRLEEREETIIHQKINIINAPKAELSELINFLKSKDVGYEIDNTHIQKNGVNARLKLLAISEADHQRVIKFLLDRGIDYAIDYTPWDAKKN